MVDKEKVEKSDKIRILNLLNKYEHKNIDGKGKVIPITKVELIELMGYLGIQQATIISGQEYNPKTGKFEPFENTVKTAPVDTVSKADIKELRNIIENQVETVTVLKVKNPEITNPPEIKDNIKTKDKGGKKNGS